MSAIANVVENANNKGAINKIDWQLDAFAVFIDRDVVKKRRWSVDVIPAIFASSAFKVISLRILQKQTTKKKTSFRSACVLYEFGRQERKAGSENWVCLQALTFTIDTTREMLTTAGVANVNYFSLSPPQPREDDQGWGRFSLLITFALLLSHECDHWINMREGETLIALRVPVHVYFGRCARDSEGTYFSAFNFWGRESLGQHRHCRRLNASPEDFCVFSYLERSILDHDLYDTDTNHFLCSFKHYTRNNIQVGKGILL